MEFKIDDLEISFSKYGVHISEYDHTVVLELHQLEFILEKFTKYKSLEKEVSKTGGEYVQF